MLLLADTVSGGGRDVFAWLGIAATAFTLLASFARVTQRWPIFMWPFRQAADAARWVARTIRRPVANAAQIEKLTERLDTVLARQDAVIAELGAGQERMRAELLAGQEQTRDELRTELRAHTDREEQIAHAVLDAVVQVKALRSTDVDAIRRAVDEVDTSYVEVRELPPEGAT